MLHFRIKKQNILLPILFLIFIVGGFGLSKVSVANAGWCVYTTGDGNDLAAKEITATDENSCTGNEACGLMSGRNPGSCQYFTDKTKADKAFQDLDKQNKVINSNVAAAEKQIGLQSGEVCKNFHYLSITSWIDCVLLWIMQFLIILLKIAASIFNMVIDTNVFNQVLRNNDAIYTAWATVRDLLNVCFILVLLFSAFCTVFQIDRYSYKKILLRLVLMALLVNFSFPITRFIIDFSNVLMYYFINNPAMGLTSKTLWGNYAGNTGLAAIINQSDSSVNASYLLACVIFVFIFAITLLILSVMLLIRIVVLAILLIFSPLAFTGTVVPGLTGYASKWWDQLFSNAFFGPIMIFMVYVAITMMDKLSSLQKTANSFAIGVTTQQPSLIGDFAFFAIPIVILWIGMGMAQTMSIAGAGAVTGRGKRIINWGLRAGSGFNFLTGSGFNFLNRRFQSYQKERQKRRDEVLKDNAGQRLGRGMNTAIDTLRSNLPLPGRARARRRLENMHSANVKEYMKEIDNVTNEDELATLYEQASNNAQREAVIRRAASIGGTGTILGRNNHSNNRQGLTDFMANTFGDNERTARLTSEIVHLEEAKNNNQYAGSSTYNGNNYVLNRGAAGTYAAGTPVRAAVFGAAGGSHPQNIARNLKSGFITTTNPGAPATYNADFENFLQDMGNDFTNIFTQEGSTTQLREIPASVINRLQEMRNNGINPAPGSRTETLINELVNAGWLT